MYIFGLMSRVLANTMSSPCLKLSTEIFMQWFAQNFGQISVYPPSAADEVSGWSWQLIPSIHDEGAGLKLYE